MKIKLPTTRYYGSKRKLIEWIWECILSERLHFESVLDLFGGSGIFSYFSKKQGKMVHYNDLFRFNYYIGKALIENRSVILTEEEARFALSYHDGIDYKNKISTHFKDIYFTELENRQIDIICGNIQSIDCEYKKVYCITF